MPTIMSRKLLGLFILFLFPAWCFPLSLGGSINQNQILRAADSPILVTSTLVVEPGVVLQIDPGVQLQFAPSTGLVVLGLLQAVGAANDSIRFTSAENHTAGSWGGICLRGGEAPAWDEDGEYVGAGSALIYCIIEYAGDPAFEFGAALEITAASPLIYHCEVRYSRGETGVVRCGNLAHTYIKDCSINHNNAARGGALSLTVGSQTILQNCELNFNNASDNGGAIYLTHGSAEITSCSFLGNSAKNFGGAVFAAMAAGLKISGCSFIGNQSAGKSPVFYFTGKTHADIHDNLIDTEGIAVYLQKAVYDINAENNYWGDPRRGDFVEIFRDRHSDMTEPRVIYRPVLYAPPVNLPTNPRSVDSIILCRNTDYDAEIPCGVADGAPLRIRLTAPDSEPGFRDLICVQIASSLDPQGITLPLRETASNSGIFVGRGDMALVSDPGNYIIGDEIGGKITLQAPFAPQVQAVYETMSPRPLAENFAIPEAIDIMHLVDHRPRFTWDYFEVVERPQTQYQIKVYYQPTSGSQKLMWDSGETASGNWETVYNGLELADGESYTAELRVFSGYLWSEPPIYLNFRPNSRPSIPAPESPRINELTITRKPELVSAISQDPEGDELKYSFELFRLDLPERPLQEVSKTPAQGGAVRWIPPEELVENLGYQFRIKAEDPFESSPWSEMRVFYVNAREEPPAAFSLEYPTGGAVIYPLHPTLRWKEAIDPDPLSRVVYTVDIAKTADFKAGRQYTNIPAPEFYLPDSLDNRCDYYWRVTAVDNTGRTTTSTEVSRFHIDTTPSTPLAAAPLNGEERKPEAALSWEAAVDPDPNDILTYEIEVFDTPQALKKLAGRTAWSEVRIAVQDLEGWESLKDNTVYYWRVRTWDNHRAESGFSAVGSFFFNRYNDAPSPVTSISQPPDSVKGTTKVVFAWRAATDIDQSDPPSSLVYDIDAVVGGFESGAVRSFSSSAGATSLTADLDDNKLWQYRIRSRDDEGAVSDWSPPRKTLVNVQEDPPAGFDLTQPQDGASIAELDSLDFQWQPSSDVDWEAAVRYRLELVHGSERFTVDIKTASYTFRSGLRNETNYTWRVIAIDNTGLETVCRQGFKFTVSTTPTIPGTTEMAVELKPTDQLKFAASSDPNPRDVLKYNLQIGRDSTFAQTLMKADNVPHNPGIVNLTIGSITGQESLEDDKDYYFRVKARDNHGFESAFGRPVKFRFNRQNDAPTTPGAPFKPSAAEVVRELQPTLSWSISFDEDLTDPTSSLVYDLRLGWEAGLDKTSRMQFTSPAGAAGFKLPQALDDNRPWFWQVRARDDEGAVSAWSPVQNFLVNQQEDSPSMPQLTAPTNEQRFNVLGPITLRWDAAVDPDWKSSVKYRVEYSPNSNLTQPQLIGPTDSLSVKLTGPLDNAAWFWRVTAIDNTGLETASKIMSFIIDTRPSVPQPNSPIKRAELTPEGSLEWTASTDPNPADKITYSLEMATGETGGEVLFQKSNLSAPVLTLKDSGWKGQEAVARLGDNLVCRWRVKAVDNHNIASDWSAPALFILNWRNDPPSAFNLIQPAPGDTISGKPILFRWAKASDPDPNDNVRYTLRVAKDKEFKLEISLQTGLTACESRLPFEAFTGEGTYYWKVVAEDLRMGKTAGSNSEAEPWVFIVKQP